ncbi:lantibiotic immunity ABC transporter MutE/EpiE family permease subunit [Clostridium estertheticum]|uniref:Lantibiotic immunity ABC transporter MutE/EpiE family permease subunit n=1 Tax=Clostridium estertheticum TaxID=238834 RepID=A0A7Y3SWQ9_9CLOT|nr:lantibiotic immunity ABC transporter MutE/EpiE family permease subunit [Clostridium estertheticum]NNU75259.1 lantibiotic immunity ABC transporter MutE/EpiE family permease subunit [Clostridium estertheticum]WBL48271.1 lantibiotic immunity ABC transporter MutE/EpiE family permease subunit [Clostridium estertheticum]
MINYLQSENLKYKRTFSRKLIVMAPLFFILYALLTMANMGTENNYFIIMVFNWWPLIFMPIGSALLCSLSDAKERKAGNYRGLRSHNVRSIRLWLSKNAIIAFYMFLSSIILIAVVFLYSFLKSGNMAPFLKICEASMVIWITSVGLIPIYLFLATWLGMVASIGSALIGLSAGVIMANGPSWIFVPWSWPLRLMCPIVHVHPSGAPLQNGDILMNPSVILIGIIVSIVFLIITSLLTSIWFSKREVR